LETEHLHPTWEIQVKGLVQGVGFRPYVYKLAVESGLTGYVMNRNDCVVIAIQGNEVGIDNFINELQANAPIASQIASIEVEKKLNKENFRIFQIIPSEDISSAITEISPDISVCHECLDDLNVQEHRLDYPFVNCTHCGPRFTIIKDLPYDREKTTMSAFKMCAKCALEYDDVSDRRFHAQPVACNYCGPQYTLIHHGEQITDLKHIIASLRKIIGNGGIVALKSMGGYNLACDATNPEAVQNLRLKKSREGKPFAVMFGSIETAKTFVHINKIEEENLLSWQRPIVILKGKNKLGTSVSNGLQNTGTLLPYMPLHYLLFDEWDVPAIVLTSGNIAEEPIIIDDHEALERFQGIADGILTYNREIFNRVDDSVAIQINGSMRMIRRSRGYAPASMGLNLDVEGIFAAGAELVNCFCIGRDKKAFLSQHIGDLKNLETYLFYKESFERFKRMFRFDPVLVVHDLHPDYLATRFAQELNLHTMAVQHHHAHIASCMVENGIDEQVIGVSLDGTGLGTDGNIWGGEFLVCDFLDFDRKAHLEYVPMPGGDKAAYEPWRMAISYLLLTYGKDFQNSGLDIFKKINVNHLSLIVQSIEQRINSPLTSSAGRLFDAVAAILNLCHIASFHAEAPMRLEAAIKSGEAGEYPFQVVGKEIISFRETITHIVTDALNKIDTGIIATRFHNTFISSIFSVVNIIRLETGIKKVALSGGVFQNRYLSEKAEQRLENAGFEVYVQKKVPANDGGIALGQLAIAAKRRMAGRL
jgi:hydrogenase maturation protein HypF